MKELVLGATMLVGVAYSKYEIAYAPDIHFEIMSAQNCDDVFADPEQYSGEFERVLCEAKQSIPFDSVHCLMNAIALRAKNSSQVKTVVPLQVETSAEPISEKAYSFYCSGELCDSDSSLEAAKSGD